MFGIELIWASIVLNVILALLGVYFGRRIIRSFHYFEYLFSRRLSRGYDYDRYPYDDGARYFQEMRELEFIIQDAEKDSGQRLTWAAHRMLTIPVLEKFATGAFVDPGEVKRSISSIIKFLSRDAEKEVSTEIGHDSVAVIRAFSKLYCNIPPFCSRREERS